MPEGSIDQFSPSPKEHISLEQIMQWSKGRYRIEKYGDKYSVVIIGETHGMPQSKEEQIELIRLIKPEFVLHEFLSGFTYDPKTQKFKAQSGRIITPEDEAMEKVEEKVPQEIILLADEMDFKIIGCDSTDAEIRKAEFQLTIQFPDRYKWDDEAGMVRDIKNKKSILVKEVMAMRDNQMAKTILEYQQKSNRPVMVIMGRTHSQNIHKRQILQGKNFGYLFIDQSKTKK